MNIGVGNASAELVHENLEAYDNVLYHLLSLSPK
jgi:hypothetical protein